MTISSPSSSSCRLPSSGNFSNSATVISVRVPTFTWYVSPAAAPEQSKAVQRTPRTDAVAPVSRFGPASHRRPHKSGSVAPGAASYCPKRPAGSCGQVRSVVLSSKWVEASRPFPDVPQRVVQAHPLARFCPTASGPLRPLLFAYHATASNSPYAGALLPERAAYSHSAGVNPKSETAS